MEHVAMFRERNDGAKNTSFFSPTIQKKLSVGSSNDTYEVEADHIADRVMRMPKPSQTDFSISGTLIQRKCSVCEQEEKIQRKSLAESIQRTHQNDSGTTIAPEHVEDKINSSKGGGNNMDGTTRNFMESRFGADFSNVRIHTGSEAIHMNKELNAHAFTVGNDIYFNQDQYNPSSNSGKHLLAHELTHTIQQGNGLSKKQIMTYRPKDSVNFRKNDGNGLIEETYAKGKSQPFIDKIKVKFTSSKKIEGEDVPIGTLSATYDSSVKASSISSIPIVGGFPSEGLTDKGTDMEVHRIEGWGYHHLSVPKSKRVGNEWPKTKYFKPSLAEANATMSYALFFKGKEAIHFGPDDHGSLACVHVDSVNTMRKLNYHSRLEKTKVDVEYDSGVLTKSCCQRAAETKKMVSNPCGGEDMKKCP